jgi:hypothetical protein
MKPRLKRTGLSLLAGTAALFCPLSPAQAADKKPNAEDAAKSTAQFDYQLTYQRGIEAVLWSMPAMSDVFFREATLRDFGMKPGDVVVMEKRLFAHHEVLTGNTQVNYVCMPYDLKASGPFVVEIPSSSLIFRFYGPDKSIYQKTWKMPDIESIP